MTDEEEEYVEIETGHGTVSWQEHKLPGPRMFEIVRELTPDELADLHDNATAALRFVYKYLSHDERSEDLLENIDFAFARWLCSEDDDREYEEDVVQIIGGAYGQYCINSLPVRWAVIKDNYGTDLALVREEPRAWSCPFSSIRHRIEDGETDFICALFEVFAFTIKGIDEPA